MCSQQGERMTIASEVADYKTKLAASHMWAIRGLVAIYAAQTADEQACETVSVDNGVGFTGIDGQILSSFAKQAEKKIAWVKSKGYKVDYSRALSPKQFALLFKKMPKYAKQLHNVVRGNAKVEAPVVETVVETVEDDQPTSGTVSEYNYKGYHYTCEDMPEDDCTKRWHEVRFPNGFNCVLQEGTYNDFTVEHVKKVIDEIIEELNQSEIEAHQINNLDW
jgi:hypothetical protein